MDVVAAGMSFADLLQTRGQYQMKVPVPYVPGMDAAGVVRSAVSGSGVTAGQRVVVLAPHGCWQEVVSAPAERSCRCRTGWASRRAWRPASTT